MRKLSFCVLAMVAVGCSTEMSTSERDPAAAGTSPATASEPAVGVATAAQTKAFEALKAETKREWSWVQHEKLGTPMHLEAQRGVGAPVLVKGADIAKTTKAFLGQHKALFKMRDADAELSLERARTDEMKMTHARFQQMTHGIPVVASEIAAHYDAKGRITSIDANYVAGLEGLDLQPTLDPSVGAKTVVSDVIARSHGIEEGQLSAPEAKLVVFAIDRPATLAFEYKVRAVFGNEPAIWVVTVDAKTGEIIDRYNNLQTIEATGTGVLGTAKKFQVTQSGANYVMTDTSRGPQIRTYSAGNVENIPGASVQSTTLTTWDRTAAGAGAAVDAHVNATAVFEYYKKVHARNAVDGKGGAMISTAHFGQQFENAFWDPDQNQMAYGDGGQMFRPLSAGLDVVAHEFTHGVTAATSNLRYQGQPGALNEAVSDIFGVFIEHSVTADPNKNWTMGEDIARQSGLLRDFRNPAVGQQPAAMSRYVNTQQDSGGVHINSGIINNAAYLMTIGGTNPTTKTKVAFGIGWEKAEKLWYRANTEYFLQGTNFAQAAVATMSSAKDIALTANETNIVDCAWKATGVVQGACATITDPGAAPTSTNPGGETEEGTGGDTNGDGVVDESDGTDGTDDESTGTPTKKPTKRTVIQESSGCNVGSQSSSSTGGFAALFAVAASLLVGRRRRH